MKRMLTACLMVLLATFGATAQIPPSFYLDSQPVNISTIYLNPDNIQSINVQKAALGDLTTSGKIYLTLKQPFTTFLTLPAITSRQTLLPTKNIVYVIDDNLIKDTSGIRIDPSLVLSVDTYDMSDVHYIGNAGTKMGIIIIRTKNKQSHEEQDKGTIRLRGVAAAGNQKLTTGQLSEGPSLAVWRP